MTMEIYIFNSIYCKMIKPKMEIQIFKVQMAMREKEAQWS